MQIVFNTLFLRYALGSSSTEDVSESSHCDSVPKSSSVQQHTGMFYNYSNSCSGHFWPRTLCIAFENGAFSIAWFILTRVVPFYLCLLHVYIVSHIAQKKNNIKCIIFVVFEMPLCHLSCAEDGAETASRSVGSWLIICDSRITDGDIYLCLPYCLSQIKLV